MLINPAVVKAKRHENGWTQQQLADIAGLSLRTIQRVESQGQGSMETSNALCAVLQLERQQLMAPTDEPAAWAPQKVAGIAVGSIVLGFACGVLLMYLIQ